MSHRRAKKIRKSLFLRGIPTTTGEYYKNGSTGEIHASKARRNYQRLKKLTGEKRLNG